MDAGSGAPKGASKSGKQSGGDTSVDAGEDSESESESSSSYLLQNRNISEELDSFRLQWKAELNERPSAHTKETVWKSSNEPGPSSLSHQSESVADAPVEEQAKQWFLQGVGLERNGDLYDAVRCYRKAMQLVPDIEYRVSVAAAGAANASETPSVGTPHESDDERDSDVEDDDTENDVPLIEKFLKIIETNGWNFFQKSKPADYRVHLNDVPVEVLSYIMRWVVSSDLDVRSLDILSNTSRGFYCICRDEKIWQMACERVWSDAAESDNGFCSFRDMFLKRPRVRFDGCYICKVTYIRPGEHSFQDQSYRPWHFVEYYRFIRFLPNGEILFLTTSDEPAVSVGGLRDAKHPRNPATLRGKYQLYGENIVSAVVNKPTTGAQTPVFRGRGAGAKVQTKEVTTFHLEFEISTVRNRANWMLKWVRYAVYMSRSTVSSNNRGMIQNELNNGPTVSSTTFDLNPNKFPPLYFSRVKSYTQKSEGIL